MHTRWPHRMSNWERVVQSFNTVQKWCFTTKTWESRIYSHIHTLQCEMLQKGWKQYLTSRRSFPYKMQCTLREKGRCNKFLIYLHHAMGRNQYSPPRRGRPRGAITLSISLWLVHNFKSSFLLIGITTESWLGINRK